MTQLPPTIDFVTARTEFYTEPTALPEVTHGSIKLDLHRRDFAINTLAVRLDGAFWVNCSFLRRAARFGRWHPFACCTA